MRLAVLLAILVPAALLGETLYVAPDHYYRTFAHTKPVLKSIKPCDIVITKTLDSGGQNDCGEQSSPGGNPLTGPFSVEGALPGDALVVKLRRVRLNRN